MVFQRVLGKGIITEVMSIICNCGFDNLALHKIKALEEANNLNWKNAMKKLDFTQENTIRECEIKNERLISLDIYAKLKKQIRVNKQFESYE